MITFDENAHLAQIHEASTPGAQIELGSSWWGFGGLHGGLSLSLLTAAMRASSPGRVLQQVSGRFRRGLREPFTLEVSAPSAGKTVSWVDTSAVEGDRVALSASALFTVPGPESGTAIVPRMPAAPPPSQCPVFIIPPEFVPFARQTEIRPVGKVRPFSGSSEPELIAWLRLVDDDLPPDDVRLIVLMDALAPSYAAVLHTPVALPTVTFTVTPGSGLAQASSPWILLRARTDSRRRDGWLLERLDAWAPEGAHLGSAEQLRVVMNPA
jgi:acyl-CoA thioesterase